MKTHELLQGFLATPELATVGSPQERAAFIALHINKLTVREAGRSIGVSKSHVQNLAAQFETKLRRKVVELSKRGRSTLSAEYAQVHGALLEQVPEDYDDGGEKIGDFEPHRLSREDLAEAFGTRLPGR
jgi:hypothetical protein